MYQIEPITSKAGLKNINATRSIVTVMGIIFAVSGICHGFFEILQGNTPTNGMLIFAIGEANRFWIYGNEPAFTLIPNFLVTGIASIIVSLAIIVWCIGYIHKKQGPLVFLLLFILSTLVGGGIGQVIFFTIAWAVSTRINKPLHWWRKVLPGGTRQLLSRLWLFCLSACSFLLLFALEIAIFGIVPGTSNPDMITVVMLSCLGGSMFFFILAFISGFAHDIERQGLGS